MKSEPQIKSQNSKRSERNFFFFCGVGCFTLFYFIIDSSEGEPFINFPNLIIGIFFLLFGFLAFSFIIPKPTFDFFKNHILEKGIISNKTYPFDKKPSYFSRRYASENGKGEKLFIFFDRKYICIDSIYTENYREIKRYVQLNFRKTNDTFERLNPSLALKSALTRALFCVFGFLMLASSCFFFIENSPQNYANLHDIQLTLSSDIKLEYGGGRHKYEYYAFNTYQYPAFTFRTSEEGFRLCKKGLRKLAQKDDEIIVRITQNEFDVKLNQTRKPNLFQKYFNWNSIPILGIIYKGEEYIPTQKLIAHNFNNRWLSVLFSLIGIWLIYLGTFGRIGLNW